MSGQRTVAQPRGGARLRRAILAVGLATVGLAAVVLPPALAGWLLWGDALVQRADVLVHRQEHLHFALHLAAGRTLSLCSCSRRRADQEYAKAVRHAPTRRERALATTQRPDRLRDQPGDGTRLLAYAGWLAVHDSASRIMLLVTLLSIGVAAALLTMVSVRVYCLFPAGPGPRRRCVTGSVAG